MKRARKNIKAATKAGIFATAIFLGTIATNAAPAPTAEKALVYDAEAVIQFKGTSTLHDFTGAVKALPFVLRLNPGSNGQPATWSAQAEAWAGEMDTHHQSRDRNMHKMFNTNQYPRLSGAVTNALVPGREKGAADLALRLRSVEQVIPVTIQDWKADADEISFQATWLVSLKQYGLKPPSVLGIVRVGDQVSVVAEVRARRQTNSPAFPAKPMKP